MKIDYKEALKAAYRLGDRLNFDDLHLVVMAFEQLHAEFTETLTEIDALASWHADDEADPANTSPEDNVAHVNGLIRGLCRKALK